MPVETAPANVTIESPVAADLSAAGDILAKALNLDAAPAAAEAGAGATEPAAAPAPAGEGEAEEPPDGTKPAAPAEDEPAAPAEPPPAATAASEDDGFSKPWQVAAYKRRRAQLAEMDGRLREREEQFKLRERRVQEGYQQQLELTKLLRENPEEALEFIARQAAVSPNEVFERMAQRRLNDGKPDPSEALTEVRRLRDELAQERRERAQMEQQQQEHQRRQQHFQLVEQQAGLVASIPENTEWASQYKYLSCLPQQEIVRQAREAIVTADREGIAMSLADIAKVLDNRAERLVSSVQKRFRSEATAAQPPAAETALQGQGSPAQSAKPGVKKPKALTNSDAAETTGSQREPTEAERFQRAGDLLAEQLGNL